MSLQFLNHRILMFFFTEMCFDLKRVIKLVFISQKNQKAVFLSILILKQQSVLSQLEQTVYFVKKKIRILCSMSLLKLQKSELHPTYGY